MIRKAKVENEKKIVQEAEKKIMTFFKYTRKKRSVDDRRAFKTWQRKIIERKGRYCLKYSMHFLLSCSEKKMVAGTGVRSKHKFPWGGERNTEGNQDHARTGY